MGGLAGILGDIKQPAMRQLFKLCALLLLPGWQWALAQTANVDVAGTYADGFGDFSTTTLTLRENGTFFLQTVDPVFSNTHQPYQNEGNWVKADNGIVLNPEKAERIPEIRLTERKIEGQDSITIKINYTVREYENEQQVAEKPYVFDLFTVYVNKKRHYHHLVRQPERRICVFAPKVRHQVLVDSTNMFKIAATPMQKIGVFTYGFDEPVELAVSDSGANYFEIKLMQPIDRERMPRSKKVVVKGNQAFFYERKGKIDPSLLPLIRKKDGIQ